MLEMCCSVNTCSAQEPPSRLHIAQSRRTPLRGVRDNKYTHTCYQCIHSTAQHAHKVRCSTNSSSCCPRRATYMRTHRHMWQHLLCTRMSLHVSQKYIIRYQGDSNPCGQSPVEFESISLTARTQCLVVKAKYIRLCATRRRWIRDSSAPMSAYVPSAPRYILGVDATAPCTWTYTQTHTQTSRQLGTNMMPLRDN